MNKEQIVYKKTSELKLNAKNPRKNDAAVETVVKSIQEFGFKNPLIVDSTGTVWCGNTRLKAARKLGIVGELTKRWALKRKLKKITLTWTRQSLTSQHPNLAIYTNLASIG